LTLSPKVCWTQLFSASALWRSGAWRIMLSYRGGMLVEIVASAIFSDSLPSVEPSYLEDVDALLPASAGLLPVGKVAARP